MKRIILAACALALGLSASAQTMDLAGLWRFQLDPMGFGKTPGSELYLSKLTETIQLPGSTDEGGKGTLNVVAHVDRLSRKHEYCGQAWYQREVVIPESWAGRSVTLELERCHWETAVYVDGVPVATDERLSTPNRFDLTKQLSPGVHTLTLCVDNRLKYPMDQWDHGTTEYTQTNWNGIVGRMALVARPARHVRHVQVYPDVAGRSVKTRVALSAGTDEGTLTLSVSEKPGRHEVCRVTVPVGRSAGSDTLCEQTISLGRGMKLWDEFSPNVYTLTAVLATESGSDTCQTDFGMRSVEQGQHHVRLNGRDIHLRGVLDCAVFPLTGYPSTRVADWTKIFRAVKEHGMNHVRFHSWCPPRAAFEAADALGLYLQVELPMWIKDVGQYPARRDFFEKEMYAVLDEYGNHPSFVLYCNGNENEGNFDVLEDLVKKGRAHDPRHLYSASTARTHVGADQFYVSHVTQNGWITVYEGTPSTDWDRNKESDIDVPVIAHETGQRCMYPDFGEIKKYTGVLEARNFKTYQERLARNGMLWQADDFFRATGAHTVLQYKEVNESLLRSSKSGGFQLLGLSDFPGQGCAFVGVLDAFWESKGLVSPEKFRESCGPVVLLARLPRRTYLAGDTLRVKIGIYQFGPADIKPGRLDWRLVDGQGQTVAAGRLRHGPLRQSTVDSIGLVSVVLGDRADRQARKLTLHTSLGSVHNEWDIWVYPQVAVPAAECLIAHTWKEAKVWLAEGKRVLFLPSAQEGRGRNTHFASHFWNPIMFKWAPMIVGTRIEEKHGAFAGFPTAYYADWQWWDVLNNSRALDLTDISGLTPVIQSIDTYEYNRKLGIAFEARVGKGRLFVLNMDTEKNMDMGHRPASVQLLCSVSRYVASQAFSPAANVPVWQLDALFSESGKHDAQQKTGAAIRQLLNQ